MREYLNGSITITRSHDNASAIAQVREAMNRNERHFSFIDEDGYLRRHPLFDHKWVDPRRTCSKHDYPYSYDEFFHFGSREAISKPGVQANYNDRLEQWDRDKMDRLWKKHVDKRWDQATPAQLSAFISEYHGEKLTAVALAEGCNASNGYPYFILWYKPAENAK